MISDQGESGLLIMMTVRAVTSIYSIAGCSTVNELNSEGACRHWPEPHTRVIEGPAMGNGGQLQRSFMADDGS